jgi:molybdopterin-containing oxidoreductase family iron-sulfur binding subunit
MSLRKELQRELARVEERYGDARGKRYWRSLEELADSPAFQEMMRLEFPEQADVWPNAFSRRKFLSLMGASLALAGLSGCSVHPAPTGTIVPYVRAPEEMVPGRPLFFATTMTYAGPSVGLLVESHEGRPTKIEGNPEHPASLGATDLFHQASVLTFYDPDRSQTVTQLGQTRTWDDFAIELREAMGHERDRQGSRLRILTESVYSPTLARQLEDLLKDLPEAKWHQYEPVNRDTAFHGAQQAFGQPVTVRYDFTKADVVVSLDADFLTCGPGNLRYVADFMSRRRVRADKQDAHQADMNRLYVLETMVTCTGAKADHRLAVRTSEIERFARALGGRMGWETGVALDGEHGKWVSAIAEDLKAHRGRSIVLAGNRQPPIVHLLAHAINNELGNVGKTVFYTDPIEARPTDQTQSLRELVDAMNHGDVENLLILGGNPVYSAPADLDFVKAMQNVKLRMHLSLFQDETSLQCHWHLPDAHYLEAWGDGRAFDGTTSICQPLIAPLYQGRSAHEVVALLTDPDNSPSAYEIVRDYWRDTWGMKEGEEFERRWRTAVHDGVMSDSAFKPKDVKLASDWQKHLTPTSSREQGVAGVVKEAVDNLIKPIEEKAKTLLADSPLIKDALPVTPDASSTSGVGSMNAKAEVVDDNSLELVFEPDPTVFDGSMANNGWLQELPKPLTKITWGNVALMSPATAKQLDVGMGGYAHGGEHGGYYQPVIELELGGRKVRAPVWIVPGHADRSITISFGYGRTAAGRVGGTVLEQVGFNSCQLRTSDRPWFAAGLHVKKVAGSMLVACTQQHQLMENRELVHEATLEHFRQHPDFVGKAVEEQDRKVVGTVPGEKSLYPEFDYSPPKHKWGMVIDLTTCVGCKACVVACQAENNIPVVGKEQVAAGREMHWLRIDRYIHGDWEEPREFYFQPVPCMHCEKAPCEYVCPVEATVHSAEGLNEMIYNRCVGTRFCSNNCPYKVRRFNFFQYADFTTASLRLQYNPNVTVRSRGVMEKCSYCVQRIRQAEIDSQTGDRPIRDGEVLTACQAACPAEAIVFGDLNDPESQVAKWKNSPLNYGLLADLNTAPRTTYLAALRNPNPELET